MRLFLKGILFFSILLGISVSAFAVSDIEAIKERLQPIGKVNIAAEKVAGKAKKKNAKININLTYKTKCAICHAAGVAGAPKFGDRKAWNLRLKKTGKRKSTQQLAVLVNSAIKGTNAMPAKGTCEECTKNDLRALTQYMIKGGKKR